MNVTQLQNVKTIITHDNCADGLASAILLHDVLPKAEIKFMQHGTSDYLNLRAEPNMLFCDFCPPFARAQEFVDAGTIVLDHHKTAKSVVETFGKQGAFGDEIKDPGVCGAVLAFRHVWKPFREMGAIKNEMGMDLLTFAELFSTLAGVRDTWQRKSPLWRQACAQMEVLNFMSRERWLAMTFAQLAAGWDNNFAWIGETRLEQQEKHIKKTVEGSHRFTTPKGTRVAVFEGVRASSDAAELLGNTVDLVVGFNYFEEDVARTMTNCPFHDDHTPSMKLEGETFHCFGCHKDGKIADHPEIQTTRRAIKMILSTRSHTTYDCSALAQFYGGGGHTKAAGFNRELNINDTNPYAMAEALITIYEVAPKAQPQASA